MRYVHSANEPALIAGVGTAALECFEQEPGIDVFIVPVGGGSGAAGAALAAKECNPRVHIVGVQAERAPAVYQSFQAGKMISHPSAATFADGLATRVPFELPFSMMRRLVAAIVLHDAYFYWTHRRQMRCLEERAPLRSLARIR